MSNASVSVTARTGCFVNRSIGGHIGEFNFSRGSVVLGDCLLNAGLSDDNRFDVETRHELDVVHCEDIRWVDHRQSESCTHAREWKYGVFLCNFLWNEAEDRIV